MLYFAYGSNMNWAQMQSRCPSARFVSVARLADHGLAFTRTSRTRGCGVADAVRRDGQDIWGVVYEINADDLVRLDRAEGYKPDRATNGYWRRECDVCLQGDEFRSRKVQCYFAEPTENPPLPNKDYKNLILSGARGWGLPPHYVHSLETIETGENTIRLGGPSGRNSS